MDNDKMITATFGDITPPEIKNVIANPISSLPNGYINITCDVTDIVGIDSVKVDIYGP
jgi:hypothetical protein